MTTEKLYYIDSYIKAFNATVHSCVKSVNCWEIILDKTAFFPEGGGQKADSGYIGDAFVFDVQEINGEIIHYAESEVVIGKEYQCSIDWDTRFSRMQQHSGEHIISGIINSIYGYDNVGFHMENDYVTIDFNGELDRSQLDDIEDIANKAIYKNYNIKCFFPDENELDKMQYRSKLDLTENVRLVEIENVDLCACCAPHVKKTGEIGLIKILEFMRHRGGVRLTVKSGFDALKDYRNKYTSVYEVSNLLSSKQEEITSSVERIKNDLDNLYREYHNYKLSVAEDAKKMLVSKNDCSYFITSNFDADMMRLLVNFGMEKSSLSIVFSGDDDNGYSYIAGSLKLDMKEIAKTINSALNGRGGGRDTMIQGKISGKKDDILRFIDNINK